MNTNDKVIIIVDDDAGMRSSLEFLLESHGFAVAVFAAPEAMMAEAPKLNSACAILDVHLPGPDGLSVYERMASEGRDVPPIFITGRIDDRIRTESRRLNAIALLEKPFSDEALLEAVNRALQRMLRR